MTVLFLVRHGVTSDTGHKLSGWTPGIDLSEEGMAQAEAAARHLEGQEIKAVYSSPIERCRQTAEAVARPHQVPVRTVRELGEVDYGKWTGRSLKSLSRTKLWTTVQRWPSAMRFPEGETLRSVQARAVEAVEDMRARHRKERICCVSHGDVIKLVVAHYLGVHIDLYQRIGIGPASISAIAFGDGGPYILTVNSLPVVVEAAGSLPGEPS